MSLNVKGQLKSAQAENLAADPANLPHGRFWYDSVLNKLRASLNGVAKSLVTDDGTATLTNKTIVAANNTITTAASGNLAATELDAALAELQTDIDTRATATSVSDHIADATDAHDASAISSVAAGNLAATNVQDALNELQTDVDTRATSASLTTHEADTSTHGVGEIVGRTEAQTLTNKSIDADTNTITNIENADIKAAANIALSKLAATTADRALVSNGSGVITPATTTATEIGYVNGVTSAIQTQINGKQSLATLTTKGDLYVATASATVARQAAGANGFTIMADSAQANGIRYVGGAQGDVQTKTTTYSAVGTDSVVLVSASGGAWSLTAPSATGLAGKILTYKKTGTDYNTITVSGTGMPSPNPRLIFPGDSVTLVSDGTNWYQIYSRGTTDTVSFTPTGSWSSNTTYTGRMRKDGEFLEVWFKVAVTGAPTAANLTITIPNSWTIDTAKMLDTTQNNLGWLRGLDAGTSSWAGWVSYNSTTVVNCNFINVTSGSNADSNGTVSNTGPMTFANGDTVVGYFRVPITNFAS
jgi:hypothetical protein